MSYGLITVKVLFIRHKNNGNNNLLWLETTTKKTLGEINDWVDNVRSMYGANGYIGVFNRYDTQKEETVKDIRHIVLNRVEQFLITDGLTEEEIKEYVGRVI